MSDDKITEIHDMAKDTLNRVKNIEKEIFGNGRPGLIKEVTKNTDFRKAHQTWQKFLMAAFGSGWAIATVTLILLVYGVI